MRRVSKRSLILKKGLGHAYLRPRFVWYNGAQFGCAIIMTLLEMRTNSVFHDAVFWSMARVRVREAFLAMNNSIFSKGLYGINGT